MTTRSSCQKTKRLLELCVTCRHVIRVVSFLCLTCLWRQSALFLTASDSNLILFCPCMSAYLIYFVAVVMTTFTIDFVLYKSSVTSNFFSFDKIAFDVSLELFWHDNLLPVWPNESCVIVLLCDSKEKKKKKSNLLCLTGFYLMSISEHIFFKYSSYMSSFRWPRSSIFVCAGLTFTRKESISYLP